MNLGLNRKWCLDLRNESIEMLELIIGIDRGREYRVGESRLEGLNGPHILRFLWAKEGQSKAST